MTIVSAFVLATSESVSLGSQRTSAPPCPLAPIAMLEEGETAEHPLLADAALVREELADTTGKLLVERR